MRRRGAGRRRFQHPCAVATDMLGRLLGGDSVHGLWLDTDRRMVLRTRPGPEGAAGARLTAVRWPCASCCGRAKRCDHGLAMVSIAGRLPAVATCPMPFGNPGQR